MWADELKRALAEAGEHLSLYQLTIEAETPFAALHAAGKLEDARTTTPRARSTTRRRTSARRTACRPTRFPITRGRAPSAGTISFTGAAHEYAGIGPGAHGRLDIDGDRHATATEKRPEAWLTRVESDGHGLVTDDVLTREETADEFLLMGLRLAEGIDPERYAALAGRPLDADAHRGVARKRRWSRRPPPAACASACRAFRCSMRWSPISRRKLLAVVASARSYFRTRRPKLRGAGAMTCGPDGVTRITARPRSLVPSARKRNRPSMPAKPDGLVSTSGEKRCGPCVFTSAATSATAS